MRCRPKIRYEIIRDESVLEEALRLQARRYLASGFIDELPSDGVLVDAFTPMSTHFCGRSESGAVIAVGRLIDHSGALGIPALNDFELNAEGTEWLGTAAAERITEFGGLAVEPEHSTIDTSKGLYRLMVQYSLAVSSRTLWCATPTSGVRKLMRRTLGLQLVNLAEPVWYRGAMTEPVVCDLIAQMRWYRQHDRALADFFLHGLEFDLVSGDARIIGDQAVVTPEMVASHQGR